MPWSHSPSLFQTHLGPVLVFKETVSHAADMWDLIILQQHGELKSCSLCRSQRGWMQNPIPIHPWLLSFLNLNLLPITLMLADAGGKKYSYCSFTRQRRIDCLEVVDLWRQTHSFAWKFFPIQVFWIVHSHPTYFFSKFYPKTRQMHPFF